MELTVGEILFIRGISESIWSQAAAKVQDELLMLDTGQSHGGERNMNQGFLLNEPFLLAKRTKSVAKQQKITIELKQD